MKLIVSGATGLVATEVLRQAVLRPEITTVVALARKPVTLSGPGADKVKNVLVKNYDEYPDDVKRELAGADACIWTVAVTPTKAQSMDPAQVKRVCHDYTMAGLKAMHEAGPAKPFRFLYMSGNNAVRDPARRPRILGDYCVMRGAVENDVLAFAREHEGVEACVAKPGLISSGVVASVLGGFFRLTGIVPANSISCVSKAMLDQVIGGFEKEPLLAEDLERLGS